MKPELRASVHPDSPPLPSDPNPPDLVGGINIFRGSSFAEVLPSTVQHSVLGLMSAVEDGAATVGCSTSADSRSVSLR